MPRDEDTQSRRRLTPLASRRGPATSGSHASEGPPPRLHVSPLRLDAGLLEPGARHALTLEIGNRGGGQLSGHTETNLGSLKITPSRVDASTTELEICIETAGLAPGPYVCHVAIRTNGGDQIVPVRFSVRASM